MKVVKASCMGIRKLDMLRQVSERTATMVLLRIKVRTLQTKGFRTKHSDTPCFPSVPCRCRTAWDARDISVGNKLMKYSSETYIVSNWRRIANVNLRTSPNIFSWLSLAPVGFPAAGGRTSGQGFSRVLHQDLGWSSQERVGWHVWFPSISEKFVKTILIHSDHSDNFRTILTNFWPFWPTPIPKACIIPQQGQPNQWPRVSQGPAEGQPLQVGAQLADFPHICPVVDQGLVLSTTTRDHKSDSPWGRCRGRDQPQALEIWKAPWDPPKCGRKMKPDLGSTWIHQIQNCG